jgi:hypothetical protein
MIFGIHVNPKQLLESVIGLSVLVAALVIFLRKSK